jgi:hypothetical protein
VEGHVNRYFSGLPLREKLAWANTLSSGLALLLAAAALLAHDTISFRKALVAHLATEAEVVAANAARGRQLGSIAPGPSESWRP